MRKDWGAAFKLAAPNDTYTPLVKFTSDDDANKIGNAYCSLVLTQQILSVSLQTLYASVLVNCLLL